MSEPIRLEGVKDLEAALKKFDVDVYKRLNKLINKAAGRVRIHARGYIPMDVPVGLENWIRTPTGAGMQGFNDKTRRFPQYNPEEMKSGLKVHKKRQGKTRNGWGQVVYIEQHSPAGNIYEKAGVVAFNPRPQHSRNPMASLYFKGVLQDFLSISKGRGRALIKAGREDSGQVKNEISKARYEADLALQQAFNREAAKNG